MRSTNQRSRVALLLACIAAAGCSDGPTGPGPGIDPPLAIVSAPVSPTESPSPAGGAGKIGSAYVAMPPGSVPAGTSASITSSSDPGPTITAMTDGGFDPVAVNALADDSVLIAVSTPTGVSLTKAVVPRRSRPVVVRTSPANRRTDVVLNPLIQVVFNEPMDSASTVAAVRLTRDGAPVSGTVSGAGSGGSILTASFVPTDQLAPDATYQLQVSTAARTPAGIGLAEEVRVEFTTGTVATLVGTIYVTNTTYGSGADPDGYLITIDGGTPRRVARGMTTEFPNVAPGVHTVTLSDLADGCIPEGAGSREVIITAGAGAVAPFFITCAGSGPALVVTTATTGTEIDSDGYVVVIGGTVQRTVGSNGSFPLAGITQGVLTVTLTGLAPNCGLIGSTTRQVVLHAWGDVAFEVLCGASSARGTLVITTTTTGSEPDPDGYVATIFGSPSQSIGPAQSIETEVFEGTHRVRLDGLSSNCELVDRSPQRDVVVQRGTSTVVRFDVTCSGDFQPSGVLAFSRGVGPGRSAIFTANADGSNQVQVTDGTGADGTPAWSAGGTQIRFIRYQATNLLVYTVNPDGSGLTLLYTIQDPPGGLGLPSWSPDGTRIAFSGAVSTGSAIYILTLDGGTVSGPFGHPQGLNETPRWSPDGSRIAFTTDWDAFDFVRSVHVMRADGTDIRLVLPGSWNDRVFWHTPDWSPDGTKLVAAICTSIDWTCSPDRWIAVANSDGSGLTRIAHIPTGGAPSPVWSPDGTTIAYQSGDCHSSASCVRYIRSGGGGSSVTLEDAWGPVWKP